jgi:hypothetical protein
VGLACPTGCYHTQHDERITNQLQLSAWAQINGHFDFNRTPLALPGIRVLIHEKPQNRETWSPHALDGWYIGPALESYQCYNVWLWDTRHERICNTISWFPAKVTMPLASSTDLVMAGIQDIIQALQNPTANSPLAPRTDSQVQALQDLTSLLTGIIKQDNNDAPSLRVDAPATTLNETTTTTKQSSSMKTSVDNLAPALRVEFKEPLTEPTVTPHQVQVDEPAISENSTGAKG